MRHYSYQLSEKKIKDKNGVKIDVPISIVGTFESAEAAIAKIKEMHGDEISPYMTYNSSSYFTCLLPDGSEYMMVITTLNEDGSPIIRQGDVDFISLPNDGLGDDF